MKSCELVVSRILLPTIRLSHDTVACPIGVQTRGYLIVIHMLAQNYRQEAAVSDSSPTMGNMSTPRKISIKKGTRWKLVRILRTQWKGDFNLFDSNKSVRSTAYE